jgi:hypothetical protein
MNKCITMLKESVDLVARDEGAREGAAREYSPVPTLIWDKTSRSSTPRASEAIRSDVFVHNIKRGNRPNGSIRARQGRDKNESSRQDHLLCMKARGRCC